MAGSRRRFVRAYLLLEGLIAIALLLSISSLLLAALTQVRKEEAELYQDLEALNIGRHLLESQQEKLEDIELERSERGFELKRQGRTVLDVKENQGF